MATPSGNGMERIPNRKRTYRNRLHAGCKNGERERAPPSNPVAQNPPAPPSNPVAQEPPAPPSKPVAEDHPAPTSSPAHANDESAILEHSVLGMFTVLHQ